MVSTHGPALFLGVLFVDIVCSVPSADYKQALWKNLVSQRWLRRNNSATPGPRSLDVQDATFELAPSNRTQEAENFMTSLNTMTLGVTLVEQLMHTLSTDIERIGGRRPRPAQPSLAWPLPVDRSPSACRQREACEVAQQTNAARLANATSSLTTDANRNVPGRRTNGRRLSSGRRTRSIKANLSCLKLYPACSTEKYSVYLLNAYFDNVVSSSNTLGP